MSEAKARLLDELDVAKRELADVEALVAAKHAEIMTLARKLGETIAHLGAALDARKASS